MICKRNYRKRREKHIQYHDPLLTPKWSVVFLLFVRKNGLITREIRLEMRVLKILKLHIHLIFVTHRAFKTIEWFSKRTGTSFQNGARSKNAEKKLGRERRRVVLKSDLAVVSTNRPRYIYSFVSFLNILTLAF